MNDRDYARTFGQDLIRGEHVVGNSTKPHARPGGGGDKAGRAFNDKYSGGDCWAGRQVATGLGAAMARQYTGEGGDLPAQTGTSIFDPVLCEVAYRWFCPPGGLVLDPFAGGSVRGIVASKLGRRYIGVELRAEQVAANQAQAPLCDDPLPEWHCGDSRDIGAIVGPVAADFIFTCPPYADLEVYSDDLRDLSVLPYPAFRAAYSTIIAATCALLKPNRFACFVVGDARDKDGCYYGLPWHTVEAFEKAGLRLYNQAILVTAVGSLPIRVTRQFNAGRKLGTTHQHVLVFVKGDGRKAANACGAADV